MKGLFILTVHLFITFATLFGKGGARTYVADSPQSTILGIKRECPNWGAPNIRGKLICD